MFALIDCNNFFVSCERVFNPALNNRPMVVLSNNDGCVISRSNEAKLLGIKMGVPHFQIRELIKKEKIAVYSTNFTLYGDMSERVMTILREMTPEIEIYSVDEAFLHLHGIDDLSEYGRSIVHKVNRSTGIPVSIGVATTKTLAKIANHFAKRYKGYNNVCIIDSEEKRIKAIQNTEIGEVWGIGRRFRRMLEYQGIATAYDFTQKSRSWIRNKMTVIGERTWLELQGIPCVQYENAKADKQQICTSRSFGYPIADYESLLGAIATLASHCVDKLRKQKSATKAIYVFVQTNRFQEDAYQSSKMIPLSFHTSDMGEIIGFCRQALDTLYLPEHDYKRAGVVLMDLIPESHIQRDLFDPIDREKQQRLHQALDEIARRNGRESIQLAVLGKGYYPYIHQEYLSKRYSTNWEEIIDVKATKMEK